MTQGVEAREADSSLETQRRQQLMRATMECVAEFGVEKTTMWMVAQRAGVSTGMVLYYYRNKRELITSAMKLASKDFGERLFAATHGAWGLARLRESVEIILSESDSVPRNFLIQYRMAALNDPEIRRSSLEQFRVSGEALSNSVRAAQGQGELRGDIDPPLVADLIYSLANGLAAEIAAHPEVMTPDRASQIAQMTLNAFLVGEGADDSRRFSDAPHPSASGPTLSLDESVAQVVQGLLLRDPKLSERTAKQLGSAFAGLYEIALRESEGAAEVQGV